MTDCVVWWAKPIGAAGNAAEGALAQLSSAERARYDGYRRPDDQRRFLTGRMLARSLAAHRLGIPAHAVEFDATCSDCGRQHGPVRVPGAALALSISHAGERVGVAATSGAPVGLDVEAVDRDPDDSLISYVLNDTELATLHGNGSHRAESFITFWTRKEAVMKATGRGLRIPLRSLTMSGPDSPARLLTSGDPALTPHTTRMTDLDPGPGYRAAVAVLVGDGAYGDDEIHVTEHWWSPETMTGGQ